MRFRLTLLISLIELGLFASLAPAQCCYIAPPPAPDMRNPGFYYTSPYGVTYGPNYCVRPPFPPFQGMILGPPKPPPGGPGGAGIGGSLGFPSHLYARSPRDYFMIDVDPVTSPYSYGGSSPLYGVSGGYGGGGYGGGGYGYGAGGAMRGAMVPGPMGGGGAGMAPGPMGAGARP